MAFTGIQTYKRNKSCLKILCTLNPTTSNETINQAMEPARAGRNQARESSTPKKAAPREEGNKLIVGQYQT